MSLSEFHDWVREVVRFACEEALRDESFEPDPIDKEGEGNLVSACSDLINESWVAWLHVILVVLLKPVE